MGITGFQKLQTDEVVGGIDKLQMIDVLREWKSTHPNEQPIVVVRLKEIMMSIIQLNVRAAVLGGSHRYYHEELDKFFQQFQDLNVKLVFFGGGSYTKDRILKVISKFDQNYWKYMRMVHHVDKTKMLKLCTRPELRLCLGLYEEGIARKYGEYHNSTGSLNKDMVEYARVHENVVAILAKDSDFLLYNLGPRSVGYWSCGIEHMNFNEMTTISFNQKAMLDHLKLTPYQFHVMISIVGVILSDVKTHPYWVAKEVLKQKYPSSNEVIRSISDWVRDKIPEMEEKPNFGAWTTMIFRSHLEEYCWLIEKEYKKYDILKMDPSDPKTVQDDQNVLEKYKNIWSILRDEVIRVDCSFIDLSRWNHDRNALPFQQLWVMVFKRAMGIVLHSKRDEIPKGRFLIKGRENEPCKLLTKTLEFSSLDVPPIEKLLEESTDEEFINKKWDLLFWVLHFCVDENIKLKIRNLPRDITPVVITVLFLLWERQITPMEGDAIIFTENNILKKVIGTDTLTYPETFDGRTIRVSHMYVHARVLINRCFQICGIDLFNVPVTFDGIHFHILMNELIENIDLIDVKRSEIQGFQVGEF